jgi:phage FluMu protein Com
MSNSDDLQCEDCNAIYARHDIEAYLRADNCCPACGGKLQAIGDGSQPEEPREGAH